LQNTMLDFLAADPVSVRPCPDIERPLVWDHPSAQRLVVATDVDVLTSFFIYGVAMVTLGASRRLWQVWGDP
jgi:hypothetical protein